MSLKAFAILGQTVRNLGDEIDVRFLPLAIPPENHPFVFCASAKEALSLGKRLFPRRLLAVEELPYGN